MPDESPEATKMYDQLRALCAEGNAEKAFKIAKKLSDDSISPVSRMVAFIKEAVESDNEDMYPPALIFFDEILKNTDRHHALIMADAFSLGRGLVVECLAKENKRLLEEWWDKVIYPKFSRRNLAEQLVYLEMAALECTHGIEMLCVIGLVEKLILPDRCQKSRAMAEVITINLVEPWKQGRLALSIWAPILAGFKALVISEN